MCILRVSIGSGGGVDKPTLEVYAYVMDVIGCTSSLHPGAQASNRVRSHSICTLCGLALIKNQP
jgi:hypothetical protein